MKRLIASMTVVIAAATSGWFANSTFGSAANRRSAPSTTMAEKGRVPVTTTVPTSTATASDTPAPTDPAPETQTEPPAPPTAPEESPMPPADPEPPVAVSPSSGCPSATGLAVELVTLVNQSRRENGLVTLSWDSTLGCNGQSWAEHMASVQNLFHQDLAAVAQSYGYGTFQGLGENISMSSCPIPAAQIHDAWMNSPGHRANILGDFDSIGIGIFITPDGQVWAAQEFGLRF